MKLLKVTRSHFAIVLSSGILLFSFQNCSPVNFNSSSNEISLSEETNTSIPSHEVEVPVDNPGEPDTEEIACQKGGGSSANPWQISDCACLQEIETNPRKMKKSDFYILMGNLNCAQPVAGTSLFKPIQNFTGSLDGNGYTISNLTIANPEGAAALFSGTVGTGKIKNLKLANITVSGLTQVAALVALERSESALGIDSGNYDNIEVVSGSIDAGAGGVAGGILAVSYGNISNSINRASVKNTATANTVAGRSGGIAAYWGGSQSLNNTNYGSVTGGWAGGIFATAYGSISRNFNYGKVTGVDLVGGLVASGNASIKLSGVKANVEGRTSSIGIGQVGGLVGDYTGNIDQSYFVGDLSVKAATGVIFAGGLASYSRGNEITNSYTVGNLVGEGAVELGGVVGNANAGFKLLKNTYFSGSIRLVNSQRYAGGLAAEIYEGQVINSFVDMQSLDSSSPYSTMVAGYVSDKVTSFTNINYLKVGNTKATYFAPTTAVSQSQNSRNDLYSLEKNTALKEWSSSIWKISAGTRPTLQNNPE